jgi:8-amino-7-oxononanoate synthase
VASLATTIAGLEANRTRGDLARFEMWRKTHKVLDALDRLGIQTPNTSGFPLVEVPLADHDEIDEVGRYLFDHGVYVTMAAYPLVPKDEVGFRIQVTAANTDEEIEHLISVLGSLSERFQLRQTSDALR